MVQTKPKAYSYIRLSTEQQKKGDGYKRQKRASEEYAQQEGLDLQKVGYEDIGVSAFKGKQLSSGALGQLLEDIKSEKIVKGSYLLVESLDRLSRDEILRALPVFIQLITSGIVLVTVSDRIKYSETSFSGGLDGIGPLIISLSIMARAHDESRIKSQRIGAVWAAKQANADTKKLTKTAPLWLSLSDDRTHFKLIEERANLVRQIFEDCKSGIGINKITRRLNCCCQTD